MKYRKVFLEWNILGHAETDTDCLRGLDPGMVRGHPSIFTGDFRYRY